MQEITLIWRESLPLEPIGARTRGPQGKKMGPGSPAKSKRRTHLVPVHKQGTRQSLPRATNSNISSFARGQDIINRLRALHCDKWQLCPKPILFKSSSCKFRWSKYDTADTYMGDGAGKRFFNAAGATKAGWFLCESAKRQAGLEESYKHAWVGVTYPDPETHKLEIYVSGMPTERRSGTEPALARGKTVQLESSS